MTAAQVGESTIPRKRALEALRNGVPNRDAVRQLDSGQSHVVERFRRQLNEAEEGFAVGRQAAGILIEGGFGSGKSHLLQELEDLALERDFVCSRVAVSKETPLYDAGKFYRAAIEAAVLPGGSGPAIAEIVQRLDTRSPRYTDFYQWAGSDPGEVAQQFAATLAVYEREASDAEKMSSITGFWSGDALHLSALKAWLKQIGLASAFALKAVPAKDLALQRFLFAPRLFIAAGFRGWVLLIDEVEMVSKYGIVSRGKAYGELARWLGEVSGERYPGLTAVAAITDDFIPSVLEDKDDRNQVPARLEARGNDESRAQARRAETGMRLISHERVLLDTPDAARLDHIYERLQDIHGAAYGWEPPELESRVSAGSALRADLRVRSYVRRWIHEWDLLRLYPEITLQTAVDEITQVYDEDAAFESFNESDDA